MKIRTDFVTNSSSSGFVCFHVKSKELLQYLVSLGLRFENTQNDVLTNHTRVILPSGRSRVIVSSDNSSDYPYVTECPSVASWLVAMLFPEAGEYHDEEEFTDFTKEFIDLLNSTGIIHLEWNKLWQWSRNQVISELHTKLGHLDATVGEAQIEHVYGFEGEVGPCAFLEIHNSQRIQLNLRELWIDTEECSDLHFAVTGELKYFESYGQLFEKIQSLGGKPSTRVSSTTNYLICNNIYSDALEMQKAKDLGIPVLSEIAFIRRFCNPDEYGEIKNIVTLSNEAWEMTYSGGFLSFVIENGIQPVKLQVWKDGKWT